MGYGNSGRVDRKYERPGLAGALGWQNCSRLEQIPEELVVDLVMELHFRGLYDGS